MEKAKDLISLSEALPDVTSYIFIQDIKLDKKTKSSFPKRVDIK
jgi:hypothetical protein